MLTISVNSLDLNFNSVDSADIKARALAVLDKNEMSRYKQFRQEKRALPFLAGRLLVKTALAETLGCSPETIRLKISDNGKPSLEDEKGEWYFSISHAQGHVLVALADRKLGVDLESEQRFSSALLTNPRFFSPALVDDLATRDNAGKVAALYWTAIEAIVKLEDSSVFSERTHFDFFLNARYEYPFQRQRALISWQENSSYIASLALELQTLEAISLSFRDFLTGEKSRKVILAQTCGLECNNSFSEG